MRTRCWWCLDERLAAPLLNRKKPSHIETLLRYCLQPASRSWAVHRCIPQRVLAKKSATPLPNACPIPTSTFVESTQRGGGEPSLHADSVGLSDFRERYRKWKPRVWPARGPRRILATNPSDIAPGPRRTGFQQSSVLLPERIPRRKPGDFLVQRRMSGGRYREIVQSTTRLAAFSMLIVVSVAVGEAFVTVG